MDNNSSSGKEKYVYLDFNGKIDGDVLKKQFFFCMANLDKTNPLVQVNDFLFKGTYDHAIGTNLFFDTEDNTEVGDAFHKVASIKAKLIVKQTEVLNLKPVKVSPRKIELEHDLRSLTYNFEWDYKTLLDKLENGTLR
ncbi:unnamed protein product [Acanthoscelides obtectus]|nr:unnamed protein product [Acanthoscelides obtectus]CAK1678507.1 hypothetical protein AOBTE_LOCUS31943 [Acanthoscelides obtectus]